MAQGVVRFTVQMSMYGVYNYVNIVVDGWIAFQAAAIIKQAIEG